MQSYGHRNRYHPRKPMIQMTLHVRVTRLCAVAVACLASALSHAKGNAPVYKDPAAPLEQRVEDLLARMTLDEKLTQITAIWTQKPEIFDPRGEVDPAKLARLYPNGIGQFSRPNDLAGPGSSLPVPFRDEG